MHGLFAIVLLIGADAPAGGPERLSPAEAARLEGRFLKNIRQVTTEGTCGEGYFSPDGKSIIFQAIRGSHPFYQIYIKDLASGEERRVSTGAGRTTCAYFHPTKPKIIYASSHLDPNRDAVATAEVKRLEEIRKNPPRGRSYSWSFDPYMDIFEANLDGSNLRRLTDAPGYDAEGSYSPDGEHIVFCSFRDGSANGNLFVMDADGSNVRRLTKNAGYDGGPFYSPDGKQVIFRGEAEKKDLLQLYVINADGSGRRQILKNDAVNWGPFWHPDGKRAIFSTSLQGHYNYELYLIGVAGGELARVTHTFGADVLPVFSPDGKRLMWTSKRPGSHGGEPTSQLWMADWIAPSAAQ